MNETDDKGEVKVEPMSDSVYQAYLKAYVTKLAGVGNPAAILNAGEHEQTTLDYRDRLAATALGLHHAQEPYGRPWVRWRLEDEVRRMLSTEPEEDEE